MAKTKKQQTPQLNTSTHFYEYAPEDASVIETPRAPGFIELLPASGFTGRDGRGPFVFNFEQLKQAFIDNAQDLPIDLDHQILGASAGLNGKAYGWIKDIALAPNGSVIGAVEWTSEGEYLVETKAYRYISPVFFSNPSTGEIDRLIGASLVNLPNLKMLSLNNQELPADGEAQGETVIETNAQESTETTTAEGSTETPAEATTSEETNADTPTQGEAAEDAAAPAETSAEEPSAAEDTTANQEEQQGGETDPVIEPQAEATADTQEQAPAEQPAPVIEAQAQNTESADAHAAELETLRVQANALTAELDTLKAHAQALEAAKETLAAHAQALEQSNAQLTEKAQALELELNAVKAENKGEKIKTFVAEQIKAGKFAPSQREHLEAMAADNFERFTQFCANSPVLNALLAQSLAIQKNKEAAEQDTHGLTAEQIAICDRTGTSYATFARNLKKQTLS